MKTLVLGSGAREHALAWRIARSSRVEDVFLHPGNAGTRRLGFPTLGEGAGTAPEIAARCAQLGIGLVVIGPEALLAQGYADTLRDAGLKVVGPSRSSARLETSKVFAKEFLTRADIPTAAYAVARSAAEVTPAVKGRYPIVLKLDGLAAGKGVVIAKTERDVTDFCERLWKLNEFGAGPHAVVVEEFLAGHEVSYIGLCDGKRFVALSSATDYKRIGDGDTGPNTGGMGAVSPSPYLTPELEAKIRTRIIDRVLAQLAAERMDYRGALYVGVIVTASGDPYVLEFNARFGDPETQAVMQRLEGDFTALLTKTAEGSLATAPDIRFRDESAVYVVAAAEGYPGQPVSGDPIEVAGIAGTEVFYAGVRDHEAGLATAGGRVLGVGALGHDVAAARQKAYQALTGIRFRGMQYRKDIGAQFI